MSRGGGRGDLENIYQIAAWAGEQSRAAPNNLTLSQGLSGPAWREKLRRCGPHSRRERGGEKNGFLVLVKITTSIIQLEILIFPAILVNQYRILATF